MESISIPILNTFDNIIHLTNLKFDLVFKKTSIFHFDL